MSTTADIWRQCAAKWNEVFSQLGDDQLAAPTGCGEWTVQDLIDHAMHWQAQGGQLLGAGTSPGDDWSTVEPALSSALDDPANLEGVADGFGGMPKRQAAGFVIGDLLIHSWDLARAIGADDTLPADAVEATLLGMQRVPDEMLRSPNMFGPPIDVGDDADAQDRLLGFVGREP
jgi:uncharacterized protein (TIGR03086 family)